MRPSSAETSEPGLREPEDVVDEEQHVLAFLVAEVLGRGERGQRHAQARARRLRHLAEDQRRLLDDARLLHLVIEVVALAGALADAREARDAAVLLGDVVDELLDQHGLADAGAAEEARLAALGVRLEQIDDLDAGLEHLDLRGLLVEGGAGRWIG
jgi:peptide chain release factor 1